MTFDPQLITVLIGLGGVGLIVGLTELVKRTWPELQDRWWPLVAVLWGLLFNVGWAVVELVAKLTTQNPLVTVSVAVVLGLESGLAASGLYSANKTIREFDETRTSRPA